MSKAENPKQNNNVTPSAPKNEDENFLIKQRRQKAAQLTELGVPLFPNNFRPRDLIGEMRNKYDQMDAARLESREDVTFSISGRVIALRSFGKAAFLKLRDRSGSIQLHVQRDEVGKEEYAKFKKIEVGDLIGVRGPLFRTRTRELTVKVQYVQLLGKAYRPLPEKFHGLTDVEQRYRMRYLDLIMNDRKPGRRSYARSKIVVRAMRRFFEDQRDFLEVETPMMQPIPGGADGVPLCDPPQRPGHEALYHANRPGALPETPGGWRHGPGLRAEPQLPQRGHQRTA